METEKTNEGELTSTMGDLLSTSKDDKNDASDSTPTSSTDAFTTSSTSQIAADDPISSTSSDMLDSKKSTEKVNDVAQSSSNVMSSNTRLLKDSSMGDSSSPIVSEKDLIAMNITDTSTEKITENVDDLVQDLENLLGEPTTTFDFVIRPKDRSTMATDSKDVDFDFTAELQSLADPQESKEVPKPTVAAPPENILNNSAKSPIKEDLNGENISRNNTDNRIAGGSQTIQEKSPSVPAENVNPEILTESIGQTAVVENDRITESQDITSSLLKKENSVEEKTADKDEDVAISDATPKENQEDLDKTESKEEVKETVKISEEPDVMTDASAATAEEKHENAKNLEETTAAHVDKDTEEINEVVVEKSKTADEESGKIVGEDPAVKVADTEPVPVPAEEVNPVEQVQEPQTSPETIESLELQPTSNDVMEPTVITNEDVEMKSIENEPGRITTEGVQNEGKEVNAAVSKEDIDVKASKTKLETDEEAPQNVETNAPATEILNEQEKMEAAVAEVQETTEKSEITPETKNVEVVNEEEKMEEAGRMEGTEDEQHQKTTENLETPSNKEERITAEAEDAADNLKIEVAPSEEEGVSATAEQHEDVKISAPEAEALEKEETMKVVDDPQEESSQDVPIVAPELSEEREMNTTASFKEDEQQPLPASDSSQIEEVNPVVDAATAPPEEPSQENSAEVSNAIKPETEVPGPVIEEPGVCGMECVTSAPVEECKPVEESSEVDAMTIIKEDEISEDPKSEALNDTVVPIEESKAVEDEPVKETERSDVASAPVEESKPVGELEIEARVAEDSAVVAIEESTLLADSKIETLEASKPRIAEPSSVAPLEDSQIEALEAPKPRIAEPSSVAAIEESKPLEDSQIEVLEAPKPCIAEPSPVAVIEESKPFEDSQIETRSETLEAPKPCIAEPSSFAVVEENKPLEDSQIQTLEAPIPCTAEPLSFAVIEESKPLEDSQIETLEAPEPCIAEPSSFAVIEESKPLEDSQIETPSETLGAPEPCIAESLSVAVIEESKPLGDSQIETRSALGAPEPCIAESSSIAVIEESKPPGDSQIEIEIFDTSKVCIAESSSFPAMEESKPLEVLQMETFEDPESSTADPLVPVDQNIPLGDSQIETIEASKPPTAFLPIETDFEPSSSEPIEECKLSESTISAEDNVDTSAIELPLPSRSIADDLDLLVQSAVCDDVEDPNELQDAVEAANEIEEKVNDNLTIIENNILPLAMEDVPDIEVLNAISSLGDNKSDAVAETITESDALLTSSIVPNIESDLPTVDEIFAEQSQPQEVDLPDDNLETLLAVASLQSVDYSLPVVEDFTPPVEEEASFVPACDEVNAAVEAISSLVPVDDAEPELNQIDETPDSNLKEPLVIKIDETEKERVYSPKITIKPIKPPEEEESVTSCDTESSKGSLKMTITKQSDNTHSILKIYDPADQNDEETAPAEPAIPKLIIKSIVQPEEQPQSPKMSTRSAKQVFSPSSSTQRSSSPRITIKPIPKPEEAVAPLKITIPKLTIKPVVKPEEEASPEPKLHSPRVTIKPIVKPPEETEQVQVSSPRITIKPIVKPVEEVVPTTPRLTIKPLVKPEKERNEEERSSPKITIKPIVKPPEVEQSVPIEPSPEKSSPKITIKPIIEPPSSEDFEESIKERIVLKINKGTLPSSSKESRKREAPPPEEEKLAKIKLKFSKEGGHAKIVQDQSPPKRPAEHLDHEKTKKQRLDAELSSGVTITPIAPSTYSKLKEMLSRNDAERLTRVEDVDDEVTRVEEPAKAPPTAISEESKQDSTTAATLMDLRDPISEIPVFEITPDSVKTINPQSTPVEVAQIPPAPRKRGRPRKVPLQVREDFKDPKEEEPKPVVVESTRPKRSCRGQSVRTTLGIKPRKPRGPGRGRGSKRGMGTRSAAAPHETSPKPAKEPKLGGTKLKELKEDSFLLSDKSEVKTIEIDDGFQKSPSNSLLAPPHSDTSTTDRADIVMYEEETRMSAETSSRAHTPAKQVLTTVDVVEESQSSVQSTATTESVKVRRGPRLEVHQEPEGAVISADQLAEYYWGGNGPFMLQEQVAQFLGIKSFKRKYPNIQRRVVDMQERDFIRESGLAGEAMCDLGLTAVNTSDILDIMYSDFQDKYEEYCKHQRDRQTKDLINKQRALSLAASQEKAKMDITQQAVQSAASWNATFNKTRKDQRKSCMDLQTLTIHFPKGKMKQISKPKMGYYPVALVPGQYTDYYREFTPTEINNLPLNTLCYDPVIRVGPPEMECDSQTDGSGSESDSSSSDSDTSYSGSSDGEDCTLCKPTPRRVAAAQ